jgi:hypothetical protein
MRARACSVPNGHASCDQILSTSRKRPVVGFRNDSSHGRAATRTYRSPTDSNHSTTPSRWSSAEGTRSTPPDTNAYSRSGQSRQPKRRHHHIV